MAVRFEKVEVKDAGGAEVREMMNVNGLRISTFKMAPEELADIVHNVANLPIRDDDIMFCTPAKSGTHWIFEIMSQLINGKPETIPYTKGKMMIEVIPQPELAELPSPRVLNSHLPFHMLPKEMQAKKTKIVSALRNPKDMCVSFYHHHIGFQMYKYDGTFKDYMQLFLDGELDYGDWFDYVLEMEDVVNKGEYNMHVLYFEDLKEDGGKEIKKIADFLGIPASEQLCEAISDKCHIRNMIKDREYSQEDATKYFRNGFTFYRKGEIGDWKNHFTVAMSEEFDKVFNERMKNSNLKFKYTPSSS